jgi:hypothetical protein
MACPGIGVAAGSRPGSFGMKGRRSGAAGQPANRPGRHAMPFPRGKGREPSRRGQFIFVI